MRRSRIGDAALSLAGRSGPPTPISERPDRAPARGFTLIEMMVVVGLIVILVGTIAFAFRGRGGEGVALANAQTLVNGLVGATRAQAALHQTRARLVVYAQMPPAGDASKYLRSLVIVREDPSSPNPASPIWVAVGDPVTLPAPVCVVPTAPVPTSHLRSGVTWNNNVAMGPVSTLSVQAAFSYRGHGASGPANQFFGTTGTGRVFFLEFDPTGTVASAAPNAPTKIALTTAVLASNALPQFNNANAVRGVRIRRTGAVSLVDEANGF